ncbi:MAG: cation diffusion facilitator family transporter, partial [Candidatus Zixiibacteriota bacterium]
DLAAGLRVTWVGLAVNVMLIGVKFWGGIVGRSQALVADAVHSISDLFGDVVVLLGLRWGRKEADEDHPYGHGRIETIAALIVGFILLLIGLGIAYESVSSIYSHRVSRPTLLAIFVAAFSIIVKEGMYWYTVVVGRRINSTAVIANAWHHRSDALSSVAVLLGVGAAHINPNWHLADSFAALIVSFFILKVSASITWSAFKELADTVSSQEVIGEIRKRAMSVEGVLDAHDIIARQSGPHLLVEMHIVVNKDMTVEQGHTIVEMVERLLIGDMKSVNKVIIHVDPDTGVD